MYYTHTSFTLMGMPISFLCQYDSCHCRAHNVLQTFWVKQHNTKVPRQNFTLRIITRSIRTPNFQQTKTNNIKSYLLSFILLTQKISQNSTLSMLDSSFRLSSTMFALVIVVNLTKASRRFSPLQNCSPPPSPCYKNIKQQPVDMKTKSII